MRTGREQNSAAEGEQLALDLPPPPRRGARPLIRSECNRDAVAFVERPEIWPGPLACLLGLQGCGKTRIAQECFTDAVRLDASMLVRVFAEDGSPAALSPAGAAGRFWFDDLDAAHKTARSEGPDAALRLEQALFHLLNQLGVGGGRLLIAARAAPALWEVALPDLRTRLNAAMLFRVEPPDDALLSAYLERCFSERGLEASGPLIDYLTRRIERSFAAAEQVAERLDRAALKARRRLTRDFAAETLRL